MLGATSLTKHHFHVRSIGTHTHTQRVSAMSRNECYDQPLWWERVFKRWATFQHCHRFDIENICHEIHLECAKRCDVAIHGALRFTLLKIPMKLPHFAFQWAHPNNVHMHICSLHHRNHHIVYQIEIGQNDSPAFICRYQTIWLVSIVENVIHFLSFWIHNFFFSRNINYMIIAVGRLFIYWNVFEMFRNDFRMVFCPRATISLD